MKDIPSAAAFALNMWLLWRLVNHKRLIDLIVAAIAFAVAFNIKVNSVFIPVIAAAWFLYIFLMHRKSFRPTRFVPYFFLAPIFAFLLWWVFWPDPFGQLRHAFLTFGIGTNNIEVILNGAWYCSGSTVPWYYPYWYLVITTPLVILGFFLIGLMSLIRHIRPVSILLLLWFFLPLTRYFIPTIGVIDGIRHLKKSFYHSLPLPSA